MCEPEDLIHVVTVCEGGWRIEITSLPLKKKNCSDLFSQKQILLQNKASHLITDRELYHPTEYSLGGSAVNTRISL